MYFGLIGLELINEGKTFTGLQFANAFSFFRIARIPPSGLILKFSLSHFGPPTAPKSIASDFSHKISVSLGKGFPDLSIAMPPIRPNSISKTWLNFLLTASRHLIDYEVTSGPTPSPCRIAILYFII